MTLYNCKIDGDHYRITKFTDDLDVESSYLTSLTECECPAGVRDTCRHRQMLPRFINKSATRGQWFHKFETGKWIAAEIEPEVDESTPVEENHPPLGATINLGPGITMLDLAKGDWGDIHNTIAEAVGEPKLRRL